MDARRAADLLGIPFYVWDFSERFRDDVIEDFVAEYRAGRTPNPCMRCNERIKFAALLERALELGFDAVCTGHYATAGRRPRGSRTAPRIGRREGPVVRARGADRRTARAHVLPARARPPPRRSCAPRRRSAASPSRRSPTATTSASSPTATPAAGSRRRSAPRPATSSTAPERSVGTHEGAHAFTIGQRRGLSLGVPAADGKPRFVLEIRPVDNTVVVGPREALAVAEISGATYSWAGRRADRIGVRVRRADPRARRSGARAGARGIRMPRPSSSRRSSRSTASPPARRRCSTTARASSASSRSTARSPRYPSTPERSARGPSPRSVGAGSVGSVCRGSAGSVCRRSVWLGDSVCRRLGLRTRSVGPVQRRRPSIDWGGDRRGASHRTVARGCPRRSAVAHRPDHGCARRVLRP